MLVVAGGASGIPGPAGTDVPAGSGGGGSQDGSTSTAATANTGGGGAGYYSADKCFKNRLVQV